MNKHPKVEGRKELFSKINVSLPQKKKILLDILVMEKRKPTQRS